MPLGARASRIARPSTASSSRASTERPADQRCEQRLPSSRRVALWQHLVRKAFCVLNFLFHLNKYKALLPKKTFQEILADFVPLRTASASADRGPSAATAARAPVRVIDGEAVGAPLKPSTTGPEPVLSADRCPHAKERVRARGNRKASREPTNAAWWVCLDCRSRWQRVKYVETNEQTGQDVMHMGRHTGKTYAEIYHEHPQYAHWAVETMNESEDMHPLLRRFALWVQKEQGLDTPVEEPPRTPMEEEGETPEQDDGDATISSPELSDESSDVSWGQAIS